MESFGRKLTQALEHHGLRPEEVESSTGLRVEHLRALQRDDFEALPGDDLVLHGLRSFARLIDADPDQVTADFKQARREAARQAAVSAPVPAARRSPRLLRPAAPALAMAAAAGVALAAFLLWPRASAPQPGTAGEAGIASASASPAALMDRGPDSRPAPSKEPAGAAVPESLAIPPAEQLPPPEPENDAAFDPPPGDPLAFIHEHGVGRGLKGLTLTGRTSRFVEGERAYFWTRIEKAAGETVHHVWLHEGEEVLRVPIRVESSRWRAHSYKILNPGSAGGWAVEARDSSGRVLARREFSCRRR
ncbi:MAG TPA: DUF2914 domain-containing protein [Candidatus Polarisedimenticolia bacterium]|nr:DUF2914 domain-containing protein [Candidatus Polarisedimenticolia bacterium]